MRALLLALLLAAAPALAQHATHAPPDPAPRPAKKPGGLVKEVKRFAYLASAGEVMTFAVPTTVRWEPRIAAVLQDSRERTFAAGEQATCDAPTFSAVGVGGGSYEYICTRLVETIVLHELRGRTRGLPWIDERLSMPPRQGFTRQVLGSQIEELHPRPGPGGEFRISCFVSHMGFEDPIVWPGRKFWHHHTFAGNPNIDRYTTDTREHAEGLCAGGNINRSAYWFPSVIDTRFGMPIVPDGLAIYYKGDPDALPGPGLRMLTGDPMRTTPRDPNVFPVSIWQCYTPDGREIKQGLWDEIPTACPVGGRIVWTVSFPDCWDGVNVDSADHKSHVYSRAYNQPGMDLLPNGCPKTHPKRLFDLAINVHFWVKPDDNVSRWRLSTDAYEWSKPAGYSAHADWWNGWDMEFLAAIKRECHEKNRNCGQDNAPDGRRMNVR